MRAATPQTLGWLRAIVRHELQAPAVSSSTTPRPSHPHLCSTSSTAAALSSQQHNRPFSTTRARPQDSSSSADPAAPPPPQQQEHTYYTFFPKTLPRGPPPAGPFAIDLRALRTEFLQLQAAAHPDRHGHRHDSPLDSESSGASPTGRAPASSPKRRAEALSARINEAYRALQSPLLRAQHLLSLRGIDVAEDERAKVEDPELLMEVLEAREMIEEAGAEEELAGLKEVNEKRIEESVGVLERAFGTDDVERAKEEAVRLRYWVNIKESLDQWEVGKPVVLQH